MCEEHMVSILGEIKEQLGCELDFHIMEGVDGKNLEAIGNIDDIEKRQNFVLYKGWAITDPEDLERLDPESIRRIASEIGAPDEHLTSAQMNEPDTFVRLWRAYENLYTRYGWQRDRARHYTDFHNRHITTGEV